MTRSRPGGTLAGWALLGHLSFLGAGCGNAAGRTARSTDQETRAFVAPERAVLRSGAGEGFAAVAALSRGDEVALEVANGAWRKARAAKGGAEGWLAPASFEMATAREAREAQGQAAKGEQAAVATATVPVLLAPDWGAPRWGEIQRGGRVSALFVVHDFYGIRLGTAGLGFVPARDVRLGVRAREAEAEPPVSGTTAAGGADVPTELGGGLEPPRFEIPQPGIQEAPRARALSPLEALPPGGEPPQIRSREQPRYPEPARRAGASGDVILRVVVEADGRAGRIEVVAGGPLGMTEAAEEAVRRWTWTPARIGSRPVAVWKTVRVTFSLAPGAKGEGGSPL